MTRAGRLGRYHAAGVAGALMCLAASPGWAGKSELSFTSSSGPALGEVADGASGAGTTTFTVTSAGTVSQAGGGDKRVTSGTAINNLLFSCIDKNCNNYVIKIVATGSPTGRMGAVTNFTVAAGSPAPQNLTNITGSGTATLTFTISVNQNLTGQVHIGMNIPIPDNSSAASTGLASSGFSVTSTTPNFTGGSGSATATVLRPIGLSFLPAGGLIFGKIERPALAAGNGTVAVNDSTGVRTVTGTVAADPSPAPSNVTYTVTGEGGTAFTIAVPATMAMLSGANSLTVTLTSTHTGSQTLSNSLGSAGTFSFSVGGSFPVTNVTPSGVYSATFPVTVSYN